MKTHKPTHLASLLRKLFIADVRKESIRRAVKRSRFFETLEARRLMAVTPVELSKLLANDGSTSDSFGHSVSVSGDTVIVGSPGDDDEGSDAGSAYVYRLGESGSAQEAKLTAADGVAGDAFGEAVAISGDTVIVGSQRDDQVGLNAGAAYIYRRGQSGWEQEAKLTALDGAAADFFGRSVSIAGNTAVVGARFDDDNGSNSGSAYVYRYDGSSWQEEAKLTASDGQSNDLFGTSVSVLGDTVIVGASGDNFSGAAYIFRLSESGWAEEAKLTASDAATGDSFGATVSMAVDTALVGAPFDDDVSAGSDVGSAYIYQLGESGWSEVAKLTASDGAADDRFGSTLSIADSTAVVGAPLDDDQGSLSGAAYTYRLTESGWTEEAKLTASDGAPDDQFGFSVSISGSTAIVGAPLDSDTGFRWGAAYVFDLLSAPTADAGANYVVSENASISLDASGSSDPDQATETLTFEWDLDNDNIFGETDAAASRGDETGVAPTFSALGLAPGTTAPVSLRVTDDTGATDEASALVTIEAAEPEDLGNVIENVIAAEETEVELQATQENTDDFLQAVSELPANEGDEVAITIVLEQGTIGKGQVIDVPDGYTLIVDGANGQTVFEGGSPALTVQSGDVVFKNGIRFVNATDTPTILVTGGHLTLRATTVEETTAGDRAAIQLQGGTLDLGTSTDLGGNTIAINGDGELIRNSSTADVSALGNSYQSDGTALTDPFEIEDEIFHQLDDGSLGLVNYLDENIDPRAVVDEIAPAVVAVGAPVVFMGSFRDVGAIQLHDAFWTVSSSTAPGTSTISGVVDESLNSGTVTAAAVFDVPGVYELTLTVTDEEGGQTTTAGEIFVVYDPSGGFVTGGGQIDSPPGAYLADPTLSGRASFGFNSKYKQGASVPSGETQFIFRTADLNFQSTSYDWLVIAGARAQYKGEGTINGAGNYGFMLTAIDGQVNGGGGSDRLRIKIWDQDDGDALVYDNQLGESDDAGVTTEIARGSIVIHSGKGQSSGTNVNPSAVGTDDGSLSYVSIGPSVHEVTSEARQVDALLVSKDANSTDPWYLPDQTTDRVEVTDTAESDSQSLDDLFRELGFELLDDFVLDSMTGRWEEILPLRRSAF